MDSKGIDQWNNNHYCDRFPPEYFAQCAAEGLLYVLTDTGSNAVAGGAILFEKDARWGELPTSAFYVHNLVSDLKAKCAGAEIIRQIELLAESCGKEYVRLDCKEGNQRLNDWYESLGYRVVGRCVDGEYTGILREKRIRQ